MNETNRAVDVFIQSGRFLLALPMLLFGIDHFLYANFVAMIVPPWIPWHAFWVYFVGIALFAAGLALAARRQAYLAGVLLGAMILCFELLIHSRLLLHLPGDTFAASPVFNFPFLGRLSNACKDLGLSAAAFLFAGAQISGRNWAFTLGRVLLGISIVGFGVIHFASVAYAPGVPPMLPSIHSPLPFQPFWAYLTGAAFLIAGALILLNRNLRATGFWLSIIILLFGLIVWGPPLLAHPKDFLGSNFLKDIGVAGGALLLAQKPRLDQSLTA